MGSACCVIARDRTLPNRISSEALPSNIGCSPLWSYQWDNQGCVAGEAENPRNRYSHGSIANADWQSKGGIDADCEDGNQLENFQTTIPQNPPIRGATENLTTPALDLSFGSNFSIEVKDRKSSAVTDPLASKPSLSVSSTSSLSMTRADPSQSCVPADSTPSRRAHCLPGHQLFRQVSDTGIPELKSSNNLGSKGRQSLVLASCSDDITLGSQGRSSDGSSMHTFSKLVASPQRDRRSFDSDAFDSCHGKLTRCNSRLLASPTIDMQTCGVCSKLLTERSSWSSQKIIASNELSVVAILVCGHVYHAECLENMTPEANRYDPPCLVCIFREKHALKMSGKAFRTETELKLRNMTSRNHVMSDSWKCTGKEEKSPNMASSSSMMSAFARPFLRRHFSLGLKSRTLLENESARMTRRKGFL